jgi:hypothetical protein
LLAFLLFRLIGTLLVIEWDESEELVFTGIDNESGKVEKIILYLPSVVEKTERWLKQMILQVISEASFVVPHHPDQLKESLRLSRVSEPIVLTYVENNSDVQNLNDLSDWLDSLHLIIVSGTLDPVVIARCRDLYPRLICKNKQDIKVAVAVIEKRMKEVNASTRTDLNTHQTGKKNGLE